MPKKAIAAFFILLLSVVAFPQDKQRKPDGDQPIRISTELVQLDVVVTDKNGRVVSDLTKDDFELQESGKKQLINFFEFVEAEKKKDSAPPTLSDARADRRSDEEPTLSDVRRIFAFIIDDLTIRYEDLVYIRQMLTGFVEERMRAGDLVAIVRTVGGKGLLQQFTANKELLREAIASLTLRSHPLRAFEGANIDMRIEDAGLASSGAVDPNVSAGALDVSGESIDIDNPFDDANQTLRAYMSLGTAGFVIESMKQLPGRKSLVLISGGLPILGSTSSRAVGNNAYFLDVLSDNATRAGVAIHTMDVRGLKAYSGVAGFEDTPAKSGLGAAPNTAEGFGRTPDESQFGYKNPFDQIDAHMGLRRLAEATGGISVLNKNDFDDGLNKIIDANDGYYLLAYTPSDNNFDRKFRKVEVKVKRSGLKVYSRRGYFAREDIAASAPTTKQEQLLAAIKSPLARRDVDLDALILYKAKSANEGGIDIHMVIDPNKLQFEEADGKQRTDLDVAGFVFDEFGKLRGGFSETITANLTPAEHQRVSEGGLTYSANTTLPAGTYQIRLAVRDNKSGRIGTLSRYLEVPDLSKERLTASSLLIGAVPARDMKATNPTPISANRQISRTQDLRYAVVIYNAKQKGGKAQVTTQLMISQRGQVIFKEPEEVVQTGDGKQTIKVGQLGLSGVKPGRYTITIVITDPLADKKAQTITRSLDFVVVN